MVQRQKHIGLFLWKGYLKTSYVMVQLVFQQVIKSSNCDLKTSYVMVQPKGYKVLDSHIGYLKTSYVMVQLIMLLIYALISYIR